MKPRNEMKMLYNMAKDEKPLRIAYFKVAYLIFVEGYEKRKVVVVRAPDANAAVHAALSAECHNDDAQITAGGTRCEDDCFIYELESVGILDDFTGQALLYALQ